MTDRPGKRSRARAVRDTGWTLATLAVAGLLGLSLSAGSSCADDRGGSGGEAARDDRVTQIAEATDVLGEGLMLYLAEAKNLHRIADVYLGDANVGAAIASVTRILAIPVPPDAPEAEDARMDARARLAKLLVVSGELDEAARVIDEGIAEASRPSFFVGNLYTVRGEVLEARAALVSPTSDPPGGDAVQFHTLKRAAIEAYEQSNQMLEALQKRLDEAP